MKALWTEIWIRCKGPWFWLSSLLTIATLWLGLGAEGDYLLEGMEAEGAWLTELAYTASLNLIALPLFATLPAASASRRELANGSLRAILFRCGMPRYLMSRAVSLIVVSVLSQLVGMMGFAIRLAGFTGQFSFSVDLVMARLVCTTWFALIGSMGALLMRDTVCAYVTPIVLCFSMSMLRSRFWIEAEYLDPAYWLSGQSYLALCVVVLLTLCGYIAYLYREVRRNV